MTNDERYDQLRGLVRDEGGGAELEATMLVRHLLGRGGLCLRTGRHARATLRVGGFGSFAELTFARRAGRTEFVWDPATDAGTAIDEAVALAGPNPDRDANPRWAGPLDAVVARVHAHNGWSAFFASQLRDAVGAGSLGNRVRLQIVDGLAARRARAFPFGSLPDNQLQVVVVYSLDSPCGEWFREAERVLRRFRLDRDDAA